MQPVNRCVCDAGGRTSGISSTASCSRTRTITASVRAAASIELGINVHKNDAEAALAIAVSSEASFVRVKVLVGAVIGVEGVIEGAAESVLDIRREYASGIEIWADRYELSSWSLAGTSVESLADLATRFGMANYLIVTDPTIDESVTAVARSRSAAALPILVGGRTSAETIRVALAAASSSRYVRDTGAGCGARFGSARQCGERPGSVDGTKAIDYIRNFASSWAKAKPPTRATLIQSLYEEIIVRGDEFVSVRLSPEAYAHGLALALPQKVVVMPLPARGRPRNIEALAGEEVSEFTT